MKRLFISLYLLLSLQRAWDWLDTRQPVAENVDDNNALDAPLVALAQLLWNCLPIPPKLSGGDPSQSCDAVAIAQCRSSRAGEQSSPQYQYCVHHRPNDDNLPQFIRVGDQVLMAGPLDIDQSQPSQPVHPVLHCHLRW